MTASKEHAYDAAGIRPLTDEQYTALVIAPYRTAAGDLELSSHEAWVHRVDRDTMRSLAALGYVTLREEVFQSGEYRWYATLTQAGTDTRTLLLENTRAYMMALSAPLPSPLAYTDPLREVCDWLNETAINNADGHVLRWVAKQIKARWLAEHGGDQ